MLKLISFVSLLCLSLNSAYSFEKNSFPPALIGDNTHVEVYTFIINALKEAPLLSQTELQEKKQAEIAHQHDVNWKNHYADIIEGELASLLKILCRSHQACQEITIYQRDGVGIATSGLKASLDLPHRLSDFSKGILSDQSLSTLGTYSYKAKSGHEYQEYLFAIYLDSRHIAYISNTQREPHDKLIGYVSCLISSKTF